AVEELVANLAVKGLRVTVLPGAPRRDVQRPGAGLLEPRPHHQGRELRAVVAAHPTRGAATPGRNFGQDDPNVLGGHASSRLQRKAFTSILINKTQPLEASTIAGTIEDKVPCPYVIFATRRSEMAGVPILSLLSPRLGIGRRLGHFQPGLTVDPTDRLLVDRPALAIQEGPDPPVTV